MFRGGVEEAKPWDPRGIVGLFRFLSRIHGLVGDLKNKNEKLKTKVKNEKLERLLHQTIKKVTEDIKEFKFNTAISAMMILLNELEKSEILNSKFYFLFSKLLFPFAPHLAQECWLMLGNKTLLDNEAWPKWDAKLIAEEEFEMLIQINGKLRAKMMAKKGIGEQAAKALAITNPDAKKWITGEPKKVIFVQDRLINFIV